MNKATNFCPTRLFVFAVALMLCTSSCAQVDIHKKWVYGDNSTGINFIDLSQKDILVQASSPSDEDVRESHGVNKAGVFYYTGKQAYRVKPTSPTDGDIEFQIKDGSYVLGLLYSDLTANTVKFIFEGEFEWEAHVDNSVEVVNPNTLELNISDISNVFNYRQTDADAMADLCEDKNMKCLALEESEEYGTIELWGRGLKLNGIKLERTGEEEAMGIMFCKKAGEHTFVSIAFSDENLVKEYETQLARNWCFPRRTRNLDGEQEVTYADKFWDEESDESVYTLTNNHRGLYTLCYFVME